MTKSDLPWLCVGDFNEIMLMAEKMDGNHKAEWQMNNFRIVVDVCGFHA